MNKKEKEEVLEIARNIESYIQREVNKQVTDDHTWREHYRTVIDEIEDDLVHTNETIDSYKENRLVVNAIELEGYKRALVTILKCFRSWEPKS